MESRPYPHNYAGLSAAKMRLLHGLGYLQGLIPSQERPCVRALYGFGFTGSAAAAIEAAWKQAPLSWKNG